MHEWRLIDSFYIQIHTNFSTPSIVSSLLSIISCKTVIVQPVLSSDLLFTTLLGTDRGSTFRIAQFKAAIRPGKHKMVDHEESLTTLRTLFELDSCLQWTICLILCDQNMFQGQCEKLPHNRVQSITNNMIGSTINLQGRSQRSSVSCTCQSVGLTDFNRSMCMMSWTLTSKIKMKKSFVVNRLDPTHKIKQTTLKWAVMY